MSTRLLLVASILLAGALQGRPPAEDVQARLQAAASFLASDDMKGRKVGTPEGEKAARWMAEQFEKIGLKKALPDGWFQKFTLKGDPAPVGLNVFGLVEGTTDELVAVCAHHDHVGVRNDQVHNGANDNASGCAVLLEVARLCAASKEKPRRGILFCSFDAEEMMLAGSRHFVASGAIEMSRITALVCMDMMGGDFFPRDASSLYVLGAENSPELRSVVERIPKIPGFEPRRMGVNVIEPLGEIYARSDYGSFRTKKVPFVFLSTGQPWHYHRPEDDVERLNLAKMAAGVTYVHALATGIAALESRPTYAKQAGLAIDDLAVISATIRRFLEGADDYDFKEEELAKFRSSADQLDAIIATGRVTPQDAEAFKMIGAQMMGIAGRRPKGGK